MPDQSEITRLSRAERDELNALLNDPRDARRRRVLLHKAMGSCDRCGISTTPGKSTE